MFYVELLCDTPIESLSILGFKIQLVPVDANAGWRVFCWPKLLGVLTKTSAGWQVEKRGHVLASGESRHEALRSLMDAYQQLVNRAAKEVRRSG